MTGKRSGTFNDALSKALDEAKHLRVFFEILGEQSDKTMPKNFYNGAKERVENLTAILNALSGHMNRDIFEQPLTEDF